MSKPPAAIALTTLLLRLATLLFVAAFAFLRLASLSGLAGRILLRLPVPDLLGNQLLLATATAGVVCLWLWITASALPRRKPWARPSVLAIAVCAIALGIWLAGGLSLVSLSSISISRHLRLLYGFFGAAYCLTALLGVAGLLYFLLPSTRNWFQTHPAL